ncbi:MAG: 1-(5-phosphoribosyl)-5-[(5-phosphoribosylamino)methylideneamino] imidazole-4-carboxamide isomerase [archaeon]
MIIPAIDILNGKCVQLEGGNPNKVLFSSDSPLEIARFWKDKGYSVLHVIDLDAAFGRGGNTKMIKSIKEETGLFVQVGGGIRSLGRARKLAFADRLVVGTAAVRNPRLLNQLSMEFGKERLVLAVDSRQNKVSVDGWKVKTEISPLDLALKFQKLVGRVLYTAVEKEGKLRGPNLALLKELAGGLSVPVVYAGGISSAQDIEAAGKAGAEAVVVGTYLYRREFDEKS